MATLTLTISELRNQKGKVCVALFQDGAGFPKDDTQAVRKSCFSIAELPPSVSFDVPYGKYSVSVLHDENRDSELNTGFLGIPQEGIGFSNDPRILTGAPSFENACFDFSEGNREVEVAIKYF